MWIVWRRHGVNGRLLQPQETRRRVETDDEGLAAGDAEVLGQFLSFPSGRRVG
jgi:hypothetical protein